VVPPGRAPDGRYGRAPPMINSLLLYKSIALHDVRAAGMSGAVRTLLFCLFTAVVMNRS